ncbi:hypothetical protein AHAS_Ahas12G0109600 [Arachis hypogaea]
MMLCILKLYLLLVLVDVDFVYGMLLWLLEIDFMNQNLRYVVIDEMLKNGCCDNMVTLHL